MVGGVLPLLFHRSFKLMKVLSITFLSIGCLCGLGFAVRHLHGDSIGISISWPLLSVFVLSFKVDALSAFFLLPVFLISPLAALYSYHYLEKSEQGLRVAVNYFFYAILTASMALVACADTIITFALAWEMMSLSSYFLVIYDFEKPAVRRAGYMYFIFAQAGAMILFIAFALAYSHTGSLDFNAFSSVPNTAKALIFTLAFIGFGSKAGLMPLHVWLPHAHPAAPSHVSAIMSAVMIKMGIYGIVRMYALLQPQGAYCGELVIVVGTITGVMGVVYALGQHDLKRLLAYSSVENIGIILIGLGIGMLGIAMDHPLMAALGFAGGLMHVLNHAIFKSLLFMGAGAVLHRTGTLIFERLGGLMKQMKVSGVTFLIGSLAICGLPPFNGFISEFLIYIGAFHGVRVQDTMFIFVILAILSLAIIGGLAIACFTKVVGIIFLGEPRTEAAAKARPAGISMQTAMTILAALCALIGLFPQVVILSVMRAVETLMPGKNLSASLAVHAMANKLSYGVIAFSLLILVIIILRILLRKYLKQDQPTYSGTWGCGFTQPNIRMQYTGTSYAADFLKFYSPFVQVREKCTGVQGLFPEETHYSSEVQDISEIALIRGFIRPVMHLTAKLHWLQHGHIQLYIGYIFFAMLGLLFWLVL